MKVKLTTSMGPIVMDLDEAKAPISTANFRKYVESGHYNGTIFHRVINGFMIQGGGFTSDMQQKPCSRRSRTSPRTASRTTSTRWRWRAPTCATPRPRSSSST